MLPPSPGYLDQNTSGPAVPNLGDALTARGRSAVTGTGRQAWIGALMAAAGKAAIECLKKMGGITGKPLR